MSKYINEKNVGILCPVVKYENGEVLKYSSDKELETVEACMTSGSLTNITAWKNVGKFDEWMFIDYVDNDFCMRLNLGGYKVVRVNHAFLNHELGKVQFKKFFKKKIYYYNHSATRNYYYVRNNIYFLKCYYNNVKIPKEIMKLLYWEAIKIIFEKNKKETLKSCFKGLASGIRASCRKKCLVKL